MASKFQKDGPKRRRYTRRELPHGQVRRWGSTVTHFKREREAWLRVADVDEMHYTTRFARRAEPARY